MPPDHLHIPAGLTPPLPPSPLPLPPLVQAQAFRCFSDALQGFLAYHSPPLPATPLPFPFNSVRLSPSPPIPQGTFSGQEDGGMLTRVSGHLSSAGLSLSSNVRHSIDAGTVFVQRSTVLDEAELVEAAQDEVRGRGQQQN